MANQMFNLNISGNDIPVTVEKHRKFRRCSMRITDHGLRVTVPPAYSEKEYKGFINKHRRWINKTYSKHKTRQKSLPKLEPGEKIPYKGSFLTLKPSDSREPVFSDDSFLVPYDLLENKENLCNSLLGIYLDEAGSLIKNFIEKWQCHFNGEVNTVKLKDMKSRWGSCSAKGNISLNWRLIMAAEQVFEYVFIHELCHLETKGHNRRFWLDVESRMPEAVIWRKLLRKNNHMLMNFPFPVGNPRTLLTIQVKK